MWDIYQEIRLDDHRIRQDSLQREQRSSQGDLKDLQRQLDKMALVNQALFEILRERHGISDRDLRLKIQEIDLRDGKADGKVRAAPLTCPKCSRTVSAGALYCSGCGATIAPTYPYES